MGWLFAVRATPERAPSAPGSAHHREAAAGGRLARLGWLAWRQKGADRDAHLHTASRDGDVADDSSRTPISESEGWYRGATPGVSALMGPAGT